MLAVSIGCPLIRRFPAKSRFFWHATCLRMEQTQGEAAVKWWRKAGAADRLGCSNMTNLARVLRSVVLPEPEGPIMASNLQHCPKKSVSVTVQSCNHFGPVGQTACLAVMPNTDLLGFATAL